MLAGICWLLIFLCCLAVCLGQNDTDVPKSLNQCEVWKRSENAWYSYVVEVSVDNGHYFCSGILVDQNWVLMSYSCFQRISAYASDGSRPEISSFNPPQLQSFSEIPNCFEIDNTLKNTQIQIKSVADNCIDGIQDRDNALYTIPQFGVINDDYYAENIEFLDENTQNIRNVTVHVNDFLMLKLRDRFSDVPLKNVTLIPFDFNSRSINYEIYFQLQIEGNFLLQLAEVEVFGQQKNGDFKCSENFQNKVCAENQQICTDQNYVCGSFKLPDPGSWRSYQLHSGDPLVRNQTSENAEIYGFFTADFISEDYRKYYDQDEPGISRTFYTHTQGNYSFDSNGGIFVGFTKKFLNWESNTRRIYQEDYCFLDLEDPAAGGSGKGSTENITVLIVLVVVLPVIVAAAIIAYVYWRRRQVFQYGGAALIPPITDDGNGGMYSATGDQLTNMEQGVPGSRSCLNAEDMEGLQEFFTRQGLDQRGSAFDSPPNWWSGIQIPPGVREIPISDLVGVRQLGQGGFAWVYLAEFDVHAKEKYGDIGDQQVAVKIVYKEYTQIKHSMEEILKEIKAMSKLNSPYIVKLLGASLVITPSITMELVPQGSLEDLLNTDGYKSSQTSILYKLKLMINITKGIQYLHSQNIIHRDLKPPNILISDRQTASTKISDFGLAKVKQVTSIVTKNQAVGTVSYMAPEMYDKYCKIDEKLDIWALGVIMQQILRGVKPWEGQQVEYIMCQVSVHKEPPDGGALPNNCPQDLSELVRSCWVDRKNRPSATYIVQQLQLIQQRQSFSDQIHDQTSSQSNSSEYAKP